MRALKGLKWCVNTVVEVTQCKQQLLCQICSLLYTSIHMSASTEPIDTVQRPHVKLLWASEQEPHNEQHMFLNSSVLPQSHSGFIFIILKALRFRSTQPVWPQSQEACALVLLGLEQNCTASAGFLVRWSWFKCCRKNEPEKSWRTLYFVVILQIVILQIVQKQLTSAMHGVIIRHLTLS